VWHAMFAEQIPLAEKILRTILVYALLAILFRITGKRGLSGLNTFDVIVLFVLSNVLQNAVIGNDTSLTGGVIGAVTLVAVSAGLNRLTNLSPATARVLEGRATTVVTDGHPVTAALRRLGIRSSELDHAIRLQNGDDISEIGHGSLEPAGQLVLTLKPGEQSATKDDIAALTGQLRRIEGLLAAPR
jgi:uncharacterized membrane protein YcaP (DUF421 family)